MQRIAIVFDFDTVLEQVVAVGKMVEDMERLRLVDHPDEIAGLQMDDPISRLGLARVEAEEPE